MRPILAGNPHRLVAPWASTSSRVGQPLVRRLQTSTAPSAGLRPRPLSKQPPSRSRDPPFDAAGKTRDGGLPGDRDRRQNKSTMMQGIMDRMHSQWASQNAEFQQSWDRIAERIDVDVSKDLVITQKTRKENVFRPGDFVQIRDNTGSLLSGVVVPSPSDITKAFDSIFVLGIGGMVHVKKREDVMVHFPGMLDSKACERAKPVSFAHVSGGETMFEANGSDAGLMVKEGTEPFDLDRFRARAGLTTVLRIFRQRVQQGTLLLRDVFTELFAAREFKAPDQVNLNESLGTRRLTVFDSSKQMLELLGHGLNAQVSRSLYVATHQLFFSAPEMFAIDGLTYRISQTYTARSMSDVAVIKQVREWTRAKPADQGAQAQDDIQGTAIIDGFVSRVLQMQEWRQKNAQQFAEQEAKLKLGELRAVSVPDIQWTKEDKVIFRHLLIALCQGRYLQADILTGPVMTILKKITGPLPFDPLPISAPAVPRTQTHNHPTVPDVITHPGVSFTQALLRRVLEDAGFLAPWQSLATTMHSFPPTSEVVREVRSELNQTTPESQPQRKTFQPVDDSAHRKEFDLPVWVIDDPTALELDDGMSFEPISGSDDIWVHVHIADPTAHFAHDSAMSKAAALQSQTMYYPDQTVPLLPIELFEENPGLGQSTSSRSQLQRALTFSVRLTPDGVATDYDVNLSSLKNVQVRHYHNIDALLSRPADSINHHEQPEFNQLTHLRRYVFEVQKRRWANHAQLPTSSPRPVVHATDFPLPPDDAQGPTVFLGTPEVDIVFEGKTQSEDEKNGGLTLEAPSPAAMSIRDVVGECMLLAGRVAAKWGIDNKVALPYNGLEPPEAKRFHEAMTHNKCRFGAMTRLAILQLNNLTAYLAPHPVVHAGLGFDPLPFLNDTKSKDPKAPRNVLENAGYVRVTSPMRRYVDMIAHWQIRHVLLGKDKKQLPWSYAALADLCPQLDESTRYSKILDRSAASFWRAYYLQSILKRGEPDPRLASDSEAYQRQQAYLSPLPGWVISDYVRMDNDMYTNARVHVNALGTAAESRLPIDLMANGTSLKGLPTATRLEALLKLGRYSMTDFVMLIPNVPNIDLGSLVQVQLISAICTGTNNYFIADILPADQQLQKPTLESSS